MSKVQYTQNASLLTVAPYILNNWMIRKRLIKSPYYEKTAFNHKNVSPNQYGDTFWVQNVFVIYKPHLRGGFCEEFVVIPFKNHENTQKPPLMKYQKLTTNY